MISKLQQPSVPLFTIGVAILYSLFAITVFTVNTRDYGIFHDAAKAVSQGQNPYVTYDIDGEESGYFSPPHTIIYIALFVFWGAKVLAFFNLIIIFNLLIGFTRSIIWVALVGFGVMLSPQIIFETAAVNIPGITTGMGLLLLLLKPQKTTRGLGWALLAARPQDAGLVIVYDMWLAFKEQDWRAFFSGFIFVLPTVIFFREWITAFPEGSPTGNTLSPSVIIGIFPTIVFLFMIIAIRSVEFLPTGRLGLRQWSSVNRIEQFWLLLITLQLMQPYLVFYILWSHLLPLRLLNGKRAGVLFVSNFIAFVIFGKGFNAQETTLVLMFVVLMVAVLLPRKNLDEVDEADQLD